MKSNAIATVGIAFVDLPLAIEPHPLFRIAGTKMESGASAALACLAVAQINPIGSPVAITRSEPQWHCPIRSIDLLPTWFGRILTDPRGLPSSRFEQEAVRANQDRLGPKGACSRFDQKERADGHDLRRTQ